MEIPVFGNEFFDQWLNQKSTDILAKVEREKISNEDMLILSLKAQVNHFHHMDIEFRDEFRNIDKRFEQVDKRFEQVDKRFEQVDKRFDRQMTVMMWGFGLLFTSQMGLLLKLYL
jgi:tetrahydromethanopterin S-methyltransferase subunit G